jgi:signal peptidase II
MRSTTPTTLRWTQPVHFDLATAYASIALLVLMADVASKFGAAQLLGMDRVVPLGDRFALMLVYNTGMAGGGSIGPYTTHVSVAVTFIAMALITAIVVPLGQLERKAPLALGLIAGGAAGNLASMLFGPPGVADFIALRLGAHAVVFNVADLGLWIGAVALLPVVRRLLHAIRLERQAAMAAPARSSVTPPPTGQLAPDGC